MTISASLIFFHANRPRPRKTGLTVATFEAVFSVETIQALAAETINALGRTGYFDENDNIDVSLVITRSGDKAEYRYEGVGPNSGWILESGTLFPASLSEIIALPFRAFQESDYRAFGGAEYDNRPMIYYSPEPGDESGAGYCVVNTYDRITGTVIFEVYDNNGPELLERYTLNRVG